MRAFFNLWLRYVLIVLVALALALIITVAMIQIGFNGGPAFYIGFISSSMATFPTIIWAIENRILTKGLGKDE